MGMEDISALVFNEISCLKVLCGLHAENNSEAVWQTMPRHLEKENQRIVLDIYLWMLFLIRLPMLSVAMPWPSGLILGTARDDNAMVPYLWRMLYMRFPYEKERFITVNKRHSNQQRACVGASVGPCICLIAVFQCLSCTLFCMCVQYSGTHLPAWAWMNAWADERTDEKYNGWQCVHVCIMVN